MLSWLTQNFLVKVPQNHAVILENRFTNKPNKNVLRSGLHFIWFWQQPKDVEMYFGHEKDENGRETSDLLACKRADFDSDNTGRAVYIELSEQLDDYKKRPCVTKDNVEISVDTVVSWRIMDPLKAVYEVDHLPQSLEQRVLAEVRTQIAKLELDAVFSTRVELSQNIVKNIAGSLAQWGVTVLAVDIQQINLDPAVKEAMLQQMAAERAARAAVHKAEGEQKALTITSESQKAYLGTLASVVGADNAAKILLNMQTLQAYDTICRSENAKVFLPSTLPATVAVNN